MSMEDRSPSRHRSHKMSASEFEAALLNYTDELDFFTAGEIYIDFQKQCDALKISKLAFYQMLMDSYSDCTEEKLDEPEDVEAAYFCNVRMMQ